MVVWLFSMGGSGDIIRHIYQYSLLLTATIALSSIWVFTWKVNLRDIAIKGMFTSLGISVVFIVSGYPDSLFVLGLGIPVILAEIYCCVYYFKQKKAHNKPIKQD